MRQPQGFLQLEARYDDGVAAAVEIVADLGADAPEQSGDVPTLFATPDLFYEGGEQSDYIRVCLSLHRA